jgi:hypothetical protein
MLLEILFVISILAIFIALFLLRRLIPDRKELEKRIKKFEKRLENYDTASFSEKKKILKIILQDPFVLNYEKYPDIDDSSLDLLVKQLVPLKKYLSYSFADLADNQIGKEVYSYVNFKLGPGLIIPLTFPLMMVFYYIIFTIIRFLFADATYLFFNIPIMLLFPLALFCMCISAFIGTKILNLKFFKKKLGEGFGENVAYDIINYDVKSPKRDPDLILKKRGFNKTLLLILSFITIFTALFTYAMFDDYLLVDDDGISFNSFFSFSTNKYSWDEIDYVYLEMGRVLRDNQRYSPYEKPSYVILPLDDTRIDLKDKDEINDLDSQAVDYILNQTGLEVEYCIWNVAKNQYLEYSEEVISNYEYYDK